MFKRRRIVRRPLIVLFVLVSMGALMAELGSNVPTDDQLLAQRIIEGGAGGSGIFDISVPPAGTEFHPVQRVPRDKYGQVGAFPLQLSDLDALVYPDTTLDERLQMLEGMSLFTAAHPAEEGAGPMANQPFCLGCHQSSAEAPPKQGLVSGSECGVAGSTCVSIVSRAARATLTNFKFTSLDPATGGGVAPGGVLPAPDGHPDPNSNLDAVNGPGRTAAFTVFSDFNPTHADTASNPTGIGFQDPLDGATLNIVTGSTSQPFGGFVQHVRPSVAACVPKPIPPSKYDALLQGTRIPGTGVDSVSGFRRSTGERAGPPYIGRGLMEAIPTADLAAGADPNDTQGSNSSLGHYAAAMGCTADCVSGKANMIPRNLAVHTDASGKVTSVTGFVGGQGRFGLRANGVEILQFSIGGLRGELGITSKIDLREINFPTLFPSTGPAPEPAACLAANGLVPEPEAFLSSPVSERDWIRNVAPPEFGDRLLTLLKLPEKAIEVSDSKVKRGAELFGIDLVAFANRMIPGRMPAGGDGRDPHAINQHDRKLNCVGCHTPIQRTGQSPATVGAHNLSYVWAPIFSDLLLHKMPVVNGERIFLQANASDTPRPRDPLPVPRVDKGSHVYTTLDLPRNLADDTFSDQKASADGREFRTAPLMGMGRMGPPFLHDGRVYLSTLTVDTTPAGTVTTNRGVTNAPLVVRTLDDAILAAIELHDLPAPDGAKTSNQLGGGCPAPAADATNIDYGSSAASVICPSYDSATSRANRSDAREVIRRFHALSPADQKALIEFLKQL
jgi:di-heme oxidoreductase (putative peroxidase)